MTLILKHSKSKANKRVRFKTRTKGRLFQFGGYVNVTDFDPEKVKIMVSKMGYNIVTDYSGINPRLARRLKIDIAKKEIPDGFKNCATEGCVKLFQVGVKRGDRFRKYCDDCQIERAKLKVKK